ncbi:glycine zipper family protein [Shewanella colwelliana]|uniref:glycine zipper family protein n=1 Tax=Shewanella colwelliana TaxID=23 RepID=UPI00048FF543|nr:glycine zipper family protein [Shewanella colwelliana]MCZ4339077.1 glycine zipper family protein [Shewanella colwelliana]
MSRKKILLGAALFVSVSAYTQANIIVDNKNVDAQQYHADMYECEQLTQQVEHQSSNSLGHDVLSSAAKGAAIGAAGGAISGGSGSNGAKAGAGIGLIGGALKHGAEKRRAEQNFDDQTQSVMRNCMVGRGYTVLN